MLIGRNNRASVAERGPLSLDPSPFQPLLTSISDSWRSRDLFCLLSALRDFDQCLSSNSIQSSLLTDSSIPAVLLDGLTVIPNARGPCLSLLSKLLRSVKFDRQFIDSVVTSLTNIVKERDLGSLNTTLVCLKRIAKRGSDYAAIVRERIFYSVLLEALEHPSVGADGRHLIVDLLATFGEWDFAEEHLRRSLAVVQEGLDLAEADRVRFLWWILNCDRRAIRFLSNEIVVPFLSGLLSPGNPVSVRRDALLSVALLLRRVESVLPFEYENVFLALDPEEATVSAAGVCCLEALVELNAIDFLMEHNFFQIARQLLSEDAPFVVRVAMLKCVVKFLPKCERATLPELLDENLLGVLVCSLEIHDFPLLQALFGLFTLVIGESPDEITDGFWRAFDAHGGWDLVWDIAASDITKIHNLAVLFAHNYQEIEPPD
jgi:hypothetical protein